MSRSFNSRRNSDYSPDSKSGLSPFQLPPLYPNKSDFKPKNVDFKPNKVPSFGNPDYSIIDDSINETMRSSGPLDESTLRSAGAYDETTMRSSNAEDSLLSYEGKRLLK